MFCNILLKKIHVFGFTSNYRQLFCLQFGNITGKNTLFAFTSMHAAPTASAVSISAKKIYRPRTTNPLWRSIYDARNQKTAFRLFFCETIAFKAELFYIKNFTADEIHRAKYTSHSTWVVWLALVRLAEIDTRVSSRRASAVNVERTQFVRNTTQRRIHFARGWKITYGENPTSSDFPTIKAPTTSSLLLWWSASG